jgi:hypothetical protein
VAQTTSYFSLYFLSFFILKYNLFFLLIIFLSLLWIQGSRGCESTSRYTTTYHHNTWHPKTTWQHQPT